jgi:acetoacetyl-CoA synthetase
MTAPLWTPGADRVEGSNMKRFMRFVHERFGAEAPDYPALYDWSNAHPDRFWTAVWEFCGIRGSGDLTPAFEHFERMPGCRFFPRTEINFAQNLLRFRDDRPALIARGEDGSTRTLSHAELADEVRRLRAALRAEGVGEGDRVAGFVPNRPEAVIAMLATASLGAIWSSCSPDFGINGVLDRFGQIAPKVLFTADGYFYGGKRFDCLEKVSGILTQLPSVQRVVVFPYAGSPRELSSVPNAVAWNDYAKPSSELLSYSQGAFDRPQYILYSSGTTGVPKCIVHGQGGTLIQHLKELVLHTDLKREDRIFYYTTCGWMMWNWLVSGLAVGATVVLYDGSPFHPGPGALFDLVDELGISVFGTSAKWIAAVDKAGVKPRETHKLGKLKTILSTGSPLAPESYDYVYRDIKENVLLASISGGTDIVSCFALGNPTLPVYQGELQCRGLGMKVEILDDEGHPLRGVPGELSCMQPFPSMPVGFWNDPDGAKYQAAYFEHVPNVWCHGDLALLTEHDGIVILGRSDATLNPGGVRIGTAEIYRQVEKLPEVMESICVAQDWDADVRVVLFVRMREGHALDEAMQARIRKVIRDHTTPRHVPAKILAVPDIPRTISGKIVELAVRHVIHGRPVKNTDALANPEALEHFRNRPELAEA